MYNSTRIVQIFQENPLDFKPSRFKLKGWTDTVVGYIHEADQLSRCLWINRRLMKRNYPWAVTINIRKVLSPHEIKEVWKKVCRKLRERGIVAFWVREPSRKNHCNYHLIVKSQTSQNKLEEAIYESMPDRVNLPYHKQVKPVISQWHWSRYITKAKTTGYINGKKVRDKYRRKRLMFVPHLGLRKCGTIGDFWEKPKKEIWQDVINKEKRIAEGLEKPKIRKLVDYVFEWLGGTVPIKRIERSFGYWSESPGVRDWANRLFDDEDDDSPKDEWELLAVASDDEDDQKAVGNEDNRDMRRRSRRMAFPKVFPPHPPCITRVYARLQAWCSRIFKTRPSLRSSHPP